MSLLSPLTTFQTGTYTVTRKAPGTRVDGIWSDGASTVFAATPMQVTPATGQVLKSLPEGASADDVRSIRCAFDLKIDDAVTIDAEAFRVYTRRRWTVRGVSYSYANVVRTRLGV